MKKNLISAKGWVPPIMVYLFMLLLTYGAAPVQAAQDFGGCYLSGLFLGLAEWNGLVARLLAGTVLFAALGGLFVLCGRREHRPVWLATVLALILPTAVYSQSYGSLNGALTVAPVAALVLFYLVLLEKLLWSEKKPANCALPLFLLGASASLFHEALSIGLCILSVGLTIKYWKRAWVLLFHSIAACAGCVVALLASKEVFAAEVLLERAETVVDGILAKNWPLLVVLTTACLLLIQPLRSERSKRCNRILRELLLPVGGFALCPYLKTVAILAVAMKVLCAIVYFVGLWNTIQVYVGREVRRHRLYRLMAAVGAFALPSLFMAEGNDGLLFVPCLLLTAVALLLWGYAMHHYSKLDAFCRKLLPKVGIAVLCCCVWISVCNGMTEDVRREYSRKQESSGATEICLPEYPFAAYRAEDTAEYSALTVEYCPWEDWDWTGYYAELRSSDSDEGEEEDTKSIPNFKEEEG